MLNDNFSCTDRGFSLVELSIVLVILGLLTGGILAGQSLIRAAEMRKTMTYTTETITAWNSFKDKYFQIPGDFTNATAFWNRSTNATLYATSGCTGQPGTPSATGTCNGDGDGYVNFYTFERNTVWDHLKFAGLIGYPVNDAAAYYTQAPGLKSGTIALIANNDSSPSLKVWMSYHTTAAPNGAPPKGIGLRLASVGAPSGSLIGAVLSPEELWRMDTKMDDGMPMTGNVFGFNGTDGPAANWYTTCLSLSGGTYSYNLTETVATCQALFAIEKR